MVYNMFRRSLQTDESSDLEQQLGQSSFRDSILSCLESGDEDALAELEEMAAASASEDLDTDERGDETVEEVVLPEALEPQVQQRLARLLKGGKKLRRSFLKTVDFWAQHHALQVAQQQQLLQHAAMGQFFRPNPLAQKGRSAEGVGRGGRAAEGAHGGEDDANGNDDEREECEERAL